MLLYHGTKKEKIDSIIQNGFNKNYGRFGNGVYFYSNKSDCVIWGNDIITTEIKDSLLCLDYKKDIPNMFSNISIEEEEGVPQLEEFCNGLYKGIKILYMDGVEEICIYDTSIIKIIS